MSFIINNNDNIYYLIKTEKYATSRQHEIAVNDSLAILTEVECSHNIMAACKAAVCSAAPFR